jgi:hypothetical protein
MLGIVLLAVCMPALPVDDPALKELQARTSDYIALRKKATQNLPPLKSKAEPEQIEKHKQACSQAILAARANAKKGDILTPGIEAYLNEIVRSEMKSTAGGPAKKTAKQGNPAVETPAVAVPVKVNAIYPEDAAASSIPSTLLLRLPKLPKELDFRFVGRTLVLRDVEAGLIIDYIPNAMP